MSDIEELKQQIAGLQARVEELEDGEPEAVEPAPEPVSFEGGVQRGRYGTVVSNAAESYEDRQRQRLERMEADIAEGERKATEGLPLGLYRDPCGVVRCKGSGEAVNLETYTDGTTLEDLYQRGKILPGDPIPEAQ